jgi:hypothetical protein
MTKILQKAIFLAGVLSIARLDRWIFTIKKLNERRLTGEKDSYAYLGSGYRHLASLVPRGANQTGSIQRHSYWNWGACGGQVDRL